MERGFFFAYGCFSLLPAFFKLLVVLYFLLCSPGKSSVRDRQISFICQYNRENEFCPSFRISLLEFIRYPAKGLMGFAVLYPA
jgi:hypothetical protein